MIENLLLFFMKFNYKLWIHPMTLTEREVCRFRTKQPAPKLCDYEVKWRWRLKCSLTIYPCFTLLILMISDWDIELHVSIPAFMKEKTNCFRKLVVYWLSSVDRVLSLGSWVRTLCVAHIFCDILVQDIVSMAIRPHLLIKLAIACREKGKFWQLFRLNPR